MEQEEQDVIKFKNFKVTVIQEELHLVLTQDHNLKTTQLIFNAHKIKLHNIYQSLYS